MDGKTLARLGAIVFVALVITTTVIGLSRKDDAPPASSLPPLGSIDPDPLREGQRRCQLLGQKAAEDAECLRVWAKSRDRFLGRGAASAAPSSSDGR
jgi:conjugative transfer region protein TrbK